MRAYAYRIIYCCTIVDISDNQGKSPTQTKNRPAYKRNQNHVKYLIIAMDVCYETSLHVLGNTYMFLLFVCLFVLILNVLVNIFFSHVGTEPPLSGYYQYFLGSKCVLHGGG